MLMKKYSRKAREKFADSLFSLSNTLFAGLLVAVLLAPMGAMLKALTTHGDETISVISAFMEIPIGELMAFLLIYLLVVRLGVMARKDAMSIYSEIHPDAT